MGAALLKRNSNGARIKKRTGKPRGVGMPFWITLATKRQRPSWHTQRDISKNQLGILQSSHRETQTIRSPERRATLEDWFASNKIENQHFRRNQTTFLLSVLAMKSATKAFGCQEIRLMTWLPWGVYAVHLVA